MAASLTASMYSLSAKSENALQQTALYGAKENEAHVSAMPTIGLDYRYPFFRGDLLRFPCHRASGPDHRLER